MPTPCQVRVNGQVITAELSDDRTSIRVPIGNGRYATVPAVDGNYSVPPPVKSRKAAQDRADRPQSIETMVGQTRVRQQLQVHCRAARRRNEMPAHILLVGAPGLGKTSLANLVGAELDCRVIRAHGATLTTLQQVVRLLGELKPDDRNVIFLDECHALAPKLSDVFLTALEDGKVELPCGTGRETVIKTVQLPKFVMVAATTAPGMLAAPFKDRFGLQCELAYYDESELTSILATAAERKGVELKPAAARELARRGRGTPRTSKSLLDLVIDYGLSMNDSDIIDVTTVGAALDLAGIDEKGLDQQQRHYLSILCTTYKGGPIGVAPLSTTAGIDTKTASGAVEPFLLRAGLIKLTSGGRCATGATFRHLKLPVPAQIAALEGEATPELPELELDAIEGPADFGIEEWLQKNASNRPEAQSLPERRIPGYSTPDTDPFAEPTPAAPVENDSIAALIASIDAEVGRGLVAVEPTAPVVEDPAPEVVAPTPSQPAVSEPVGARSVWNGTVTVGLMSVPVQLFAAHTDTHGVALHQCHEECGSRLSQRMACKSCDTIVDSSEIGRTDGEHTITGADYKMLAASQLKSIDLGEFVPASDVDPMLFETTYTLGAGKNGEKAMALLHAALQAEGRIGVGRIVLRSVERVVALYAVDGQLRMSVLRWVDQIKPAIEVPQVEVSESELDQARALVASMATKFVHEAHKDPRQERLAALLEG